MSVTITRLRNGERIPNVQSIVNPHSNPWDLADLTLYLHYNCPECNFVSKQDFMFVNHMQENHSVFNSSKPKPEDLIQKFLIEEGCDQKLETLENQTLKLPVKDFYDPNPSPFLVKDKTPTNYSVSITKVDKPLDFEDEEPYFEGLEEPLEDLGKFQYLF